MNKKKNQYKKLLVLAVFLLGLALLPMISQATTYVPMEEIPGFGRQSDFFNYINSLYNFGIAAVGIAAMIMLGIGGFMYITSAGNASRMETAKSYIWDALIGLILALSAYLILKTINPDLIRIIRPPADMIPFVSTGPGAPTPGVPPVIPPVIPPVAGCPTCVSAAGTSLTCKDATSCTMVPSLLARLQQVNSTVPWRITEAYPPTVPHSSSCHNNGNCVDINTFPVSTSVSDVVALAAALRAAGFTSFQYESPNCAAYTAAGVLCRTPSTMTASSFHVNNG